MNFDKREANFKKYSDMGMDAPSITKERAARVPKHYMQAGIAYQNYDQLRKYIDQYTKDKLKAIPKGLTIEEADKEWDKILGQEKELYDKLARGDDEELIKAAKESGFDIKDPMSYMDNDTYNFEYKDEDSVPHPIQRFLFGLEEDDREELKDTLRTGGRGNYIGAILDRYNTKSSLDKDADNKIEKKEIKQAVKEEMTPEEKAKIKGDIEEAVSNEDSNAEFREPTGMYNTPAAMAEIFKNNREISDERCKEMRRKSIEKMKNGWGETDVMKKKKKEEEKNKGK